MSNTDMTKTLASELAQRQLSGLYRRRRLLASPQGPEMIVNGRPFLAFCSNDYLGLANDPRVQAALCHGAAEYGVGSGAAHLVSGHMIPHQALEQALADLVKRPRALLFSTGYMANLGVLTALLGRGDTIWQDRYNHASLLDGGLLSKAKLRRYPHLHIKVLQARIQHRLVRVNTSQAQTTERCIIATDGVFSMDGDIAPLPELAALAMDHGAWLMVDDAHGIGVLGANGGGTTELYALDVTQVPILMGTLGKALGVFGAFVAGTAELIETLIQQARSFIYTTALPPALAVATLQAIDILRLEPWRRQHLQELIAQFRNGVAAMDLPVLASTSAIQPLIAKTADRALKWSSYLETQGILIPAIRPPTVPIGQARLRITLTAAHTTEQIQHLLAALSNLPDMDLG